MASSDSTLFPIQSLPQILPQHLVLLAALNQQQNPPQQLALSPIILQQQFLPQLSPLHSIPSLKCQSPSSSSNGLLLFPSPPSISPAIAQQSASFTNRLRPLLNSLLNGFQAIPVRMKVGRLVFSI
jgi:hypothetical protein